MARAFVHLTIAAFLLAACKAEDVTVRLTGEQVVAAAAGQPSAAPFKAELGESSTTLDPERRAMITGIAALLPAHFPGVEVDTDIGADEWAIEVEGTLPVGEPAGTPWHVATQPQPGGGILVSLQPAGGFDAFVAAMEAINSTIGPDAAQPVQFRFTAATGRVMVGGVVIDGEPVGFATIPMTGQTLRLMFEDGVWDDTPGAFLYLPD